MFNNYPVFNFTAKLIKVFKNKKRNSLLSVSFFLLCGERGFVPKILYYFVLFYNFIKINKL